MERCQECCISNLHSFLFLWRYRSPLLKEKKDYVFSADSGELWKPLCGGEDGDVPGSCLGLKRDHWFPPHICPAVFKRPLRSSSPRFNLPPSALIYLYRCLCQTTSPFVPNRHEVMLPVRESCPAVLHFSCRGGLLSASTQSCRSSRPQSILGEQFPSSVLSAVVAPLNLGTAAFPSSNPPPQILSSARSSCVQAPSDRNPSMCESGGDSLTSCLFSVVLPPSVGRSS